MFRLTGFVTRVDHKQGDKPQADGTSKHWAMDNITVLVANQAVVVVSRFADSATPCPTVGEGVDYAVEVRPRGAFLNVNLDQPWSQLVPEHVGRGKIDHAA